MQCPNYDSIATGHVSLPFAIVITLRSFASFFAWYSGLLFPLFCCTSR